MSHPLNPCASKGIFVIPVLIPPAELKAIKDLVEGLGALPSTFASANILITNIRAPKRLERETRALAVGFELPDYSDDEEHEEQLEDDPRCKEKKKLQAKLERAEARKQRELKCKLTIHSDWLRECQKQQTMVDFWPCYVYLPGDSAAKRQEEKRKTQEEGANFNDSIKKVKDNGKSDGSTAGKVLDEAEASQTQTQLEGSFFLQQSSSQIEGDADSDEDQEDEDEEEDEAAALARLKAMTKRQVFTSPEQPPAWKDSGQACERPTPLQSRYNQDLVDELHVIQRERELSGDDQSALSYSRAVSALKAFPDDLRTDPSKAKHITGVGSKTYTLVEQYYKLGKIVEAEIIRLDCAFQVLNEFTSIYRVGPKGARELWEEGFRCIPQLIRAQRWNPCTNAKVPHGHAHGQRKTASETSISISEALRIWPDLNVPIPREEIEEIDQMIANELHHILPGTVRQIVGGYRRGKIATMDLDVVYSYPPVAAAQSQDGGGQAKELSIAETTEYMHALKDRLESKGLITHYISLHNMKSERHRGRDGGGSSRKRKVTGNEGEGDRNDPDGEDLHVLEFVLKPPTSPTIPVSRHRRVDVLFAPYRVYGATVLGWTGSRMFERDLRRRARGRDFKFSSNGLVDLHSKEVVRTTDEKEIFRVLGLNYIPPEWRNCDA